MSVTIPISLPIRVFVVIGNPNLIFCINMKKVGFMSLGAIAQTTKIHLVCQLGMSQMHENIVGNWLCELK